jgi:mRNA-degrading endonuclease toxin of MazEF toxin-antitoxin module
MEKRFDEWIALKKGLDRREQAAPFVSDGDIWWTSAGENVGSEINGKSGLFSRPVVIYKKLSHGLYFVIPTSTQEKTGSWFVGFRQHGKEMVACLHQARTIDHRRLSSKLGALDDEDFERIKDGFRRLYK